MVSEECDIRDQVQLDCINEISFSLVQKDMETAKNGYHIVLETVKHYFAGNRLNNREPRYPIDNKNLSMVIY